MMRMSFGSGPVASWISTWGEGWTSGDGELRELAIPNGEDVLDGLDSSAGVDTPQLREGVGGAGAGAWSGTPAGGSSAFGVLTFSLASLCDWVIKLMRIFLTPLAR